MILDGCVAVCLLLSAHRAVMFVIAQLSFIVTLSAVHYGGEACYSFWPTVLSVEPMVQYVVCLSVCL